MILLLHSGMKTNKLTKILKGTLLTLTAALSLWSCSKNSSDKNVTTYSMQNGQCVLSSTGQVVNQTLCNNLYTLNANGTCVVTATGQQVNVSLCNNIGNGVAQYTYQNGMCVNISTNQTVQPYQTGMSQQCYGTFTNGYQTNQCNGNCAGYTLLDLSTCRIVNCI